MFNISYSKEIDNRDNFGVFFCKRGIRSGVEIGVDRGVFSLEILGRSGLELLVCVDNWEPYWEMPWSRESDYLMTVMRLQHFGSRVKVVRDSCQSFCEKISRMTEKTWLPEGPSKFGFFYIDSDHQKEHVANDINYCWPLVKDGGVLSGHDWSEKTHPGVVEAVTEFAKANSLEVFLTPDGPNSSWYIFKR